MTDLLYRYQQILTALRDSTDGLTNKQIIEHCKKMRPNEVPNDITQMGLNTQALRRRELLTTTDTAAGKIHRITDKGLEILAAATGDPLPKAEPETPPTEPHQPLMPHEPDIEKALDDTMPVCEISQTDAQADGSHSPLTLESLNAAYNPVPLAAPDPLAEFDKAAAIMRQCIQDALIEAAYPEQFAKIADKGRKIATLERLEALVAEDIAHVLRAIREDLQLLEAA